MNFIFVNLVSDNRRRLHIDKIHKSEIHLYIELADLVF